ncbi:MAG: hypothetical protein LBB77_10730 [Treponema sp.]|nr:hypothetical protein [Treponema sp.]
MAKVSKTPADSPKSGGGYGIFIIILISAVAAAAISIASLFEIYEDEKWTPPSGEFRSNSFYLLGEWLSASGRPARFSPRWTGMKNIPPQAGGLFIQASLFDWGSEDILSWVREGGVLVISVDFPWYREDGEKKEMPPAVLAMEKFLEKLGIKIRKLSWEEPAAPGEAENPSAETEDPTAGSTIDPTAGNTIDTTAGSTTDAAADSVINSITDDENGAGIDMSAGEDDSNTADFDEFTVFPDYDYGIVFDDPGIRAGLSAGPSAAAVAEGPAEGLLPGESFLTLRDSEGNIRLIRGSLGKGRIAVTGSCVFMYNYSLKDEVNARLAWELTGGSLGPERPAFLFIRGRRGSGGLLEILRGRGNLPPLVLSALVLIFAGFWMALSGFGVPPREESRKRLSITGRFSAEARFLRRYSALEAYLEIYLRELRRLGRGRALGREVEEVEEALAAGEKIGPIKTAVYLKNLMSALERL